MERTDLLDTSPEMHRRRIQLLREKGVEWRIRTTIELIDMSRALFPEQTKAALERVQKPK